MPEYSYHKEPNKEWLCNITNTLINDEFKDFIQEKIDKRNKDSIKAQISELVLIKSLWTLLRDLKLYQPRKEYHISSQRIN